MARNTRTACRLCRRVNEKLMLKGEKCLTPKCTLEKRSVPPGKRTSSRSRPKRISDRGLQLREKQKARYTYGVLERQFRRFFSEAVRLPGITGENLLSLLERRLDNVVYRLGFANSRAQARQLVRHGHFVVNGRRTDIPSFLTKPADVIEWYESGKKTEYYKRLTEIIRDFAVPGWLGLDSQKLEGRVLTLPTRTDVEIKLDEKAIVEYYSR